MNNTLRLLVVQTSLFWEDVDANLSSLKEKLLNSPKGADIIVLPEMFASGFTMKGKEKIAERYNDVVDWMKEISSSLGSAITGSTAYLEDGRYFNRFVFVNPDGQVDCYNKRHLFTMGEEPEHFHAGNDLITIEYKGWNIRPFICYDLRFPVWSRNTKQYDLALYVANWPAARSDAWQTLLKARAIENQAYVVGVNCVGEDGMNLAYSGDSTVFDAKGQAVLKCTPFKEEIKVINLNYEELQEFRRRFPVLNDADSFRIV